MKGLKVMAVLARPDDLSVAAGGALAQSAAAGAETYLVLGSLGDADRAALNEAVHRAGVRETFVLTFPGEGLDAIDPAMLVLRIAEHIRLIRPEVVAFDPAEPRAWDPERVIVAELAETAVAAAADPAYVVPSGAPAHRPWIVDAPVLPPTPSRRVA